MGQLIGLVFYVIFLGRLCVLNKSLRVARQNSKIRGCCSWFERPGTHQFSGQLVDSKRYNVALEWACASEYLSTGTGGKEIL